MASSIDEDVVSAPSAGFLCMYVDDVIGMYYDVILVCVLYYRTDVDMEAGMLTVLSPAPHPLPRKILIKTNLQFMDFK